MSLTELQEKRGRLMTQAREAIDEVDKNTDDSRAAELNERADKFFAELDQIDARIEREEKMSALEARANEAREREEREQREQRRPGSNGEQRGSDDGETMSYRVAFNELMKAGGDKSEMSAEARAALAAGYSKLAKEERAQTTTNAAGGYTIPTELMPEIVKTMLAFGPMYDPGITRELVTAGGGQLDWTTMNDTASTAGAHTEGATLTDDGGKDVVFGTLALNAYAFDTEWLRVSKELADDSIFAMEAVIADALGERLGRIANSKLTTGSGSSDVQGIVTGAGVATAAASTSAITADEIIDFVHSVDPAYRGAPSVRFMFHDSTLKAIRKLKDGNGNYLWSMGNVQQGVPGSLLGYSYSINQDMAELSDGVSSKVMLFGDMRKFVVRKVGAPLIGALQDKDFWPGFGIAGYIRFDGGVLDSTAIKALPLAAA